MSLAGWTSRGGQQLQGPQVARPSGGLEQAAATNRCLLLAGELAASARARLFAVAQPPDCLRRSDNTLGPADRRTARGDADCDLLIARTRIGGQKDLSPLQLACRLFATAQQLGEVFALGLAQLHPRPAISSSPPRGRRKTYWVTCQNSDSAGSSTPRRFTEKQGQYLAFIYVYSRMFRQAPAEADIQRHFRVSPPSVHQMIITLSLCRIDQPANPASQEASSCSLPQNTCQS